MAAAVVVDGYHERQTLLHCGRHALNNLIGEESPWVSHEMLSDIADNLRRRDESECDLQTIL
jgi:alcohol dehydrogenase YqhD (iron-dependent ADH family)